MFVLSCDRAYLYAHPERELTVEEESKYQEVLARRASGMPSQYITGHQEFWGLDFIVTPAVLIPRPETEHLIEVLLAQAKKLKHSKIVDVGTGSGCIAITLSKELPEAEIHATDVSPDALEVAKTNAARYPFANRIQFHQKDLLNGLPQNYFDFVISNPPYVGESEEDTVQLEVRKFEPRTAVFAGTVGTEIIERLIQQAQFALKPQGLLLMEISGTIVENTKELLSGWENVEITNDLQGIPRVVSARKP